MCNRGKKLFSNHLSKDHSLLTNLQISNFHFDSDSKSENEDTIMLFRSKIPLTLS